MPAQYAIDVEQRLVRTIFSGVVTLEDVVTHIGRLRDDPQFDPNFSELVDLSTASEVLLGYADFHHLAAIDPFAHDIRRAFLVPSQGAVYGVTRMFHIIRNESPQIRIVHTMAEAMDWVAKRD